MERMTPDKRADTYPDEWDDPLMNPDGSVAWLGIVAWLAALTAGAAFWFWLVIEISYIIRPTP